MQGEMFVTKALNKFPNITYYMFLHKNIRPRIPKVLWYIIIKSLVESMDPELLIAILGKIKSNVVLAIQLSDNIYETVHYFPTDDDFVDVEQM